MNGKLDRIYSNSGRINSKVCACGCRLVPFAHMDLTCTTRLLCSSPYVIRLVIQRDTIESATIIPKNNDHPGSAC